MEENMPEIKNALCADIYEEEIDADIKTLKRFREAWMRHSFHSESEMFQYADDDFYFYRFAIDREEKSRISFLDSIIYRVLERYGVDFETPDQRERAPFDFIINAEDGRLGYSFEMYYEDELPEIFDRLRIDKAYVIRTIHGTESKFITWNNERYKRENKQIEEIPIQLFFEKYTSKQEYQEFERHINRYIEESRKILGYQSIKVLSKMNLSSRKLFEEKVLRNWDYENKRYQIIDSNNPKIQTIAYVQDYDLKEYWIKIRQNYVDEKLYKSMVGTESYAESFITSEWLYYSLKGTENFDYTAVVSGYLKSIEQLLCKLVMLNIDNGCVISLSGAKKIRKKAIDNGLTFYDLKWDKSSNSNVKTVVDLSKERLPAYPYIDFTEEQKEYMDSSIGTFEFFLRNNPSIFIDTSVSKAICDMVSCFRTECRNGYFHTHNLHDASIIDKTRENAILLYAILLGAVAIAKDKKAELGIISEDRFDLICKEIREIQHYTTDFIFEYNDGTEKKMVYDGINNVAEYTEDGVEHYESLIFYEVDDFSLETYEKLDTPIRKDWKRLLTRDTLPCRIHCYGKNSNHEVSPELLK